MTQAPVLSRPPWSFKTNAWLKTTKVFVHVIYGSAVGEMPW